MRLSIIIVTYNSRNELDECLSSLVEHAPTIESEIVLVDNGSTDGTPAYVRARWPLVRLIEAGRNLGFGAGNNLGIRQSAGELVLLLNPDTSVPAGAIDSLVSELLAHSGTAVVGPRIVDADGHAELSFGRMMSPWAELRQKVLVRGSGGPVAPLRPVVERMTRTSQYVDWVSGACLLAWRRDLEAAGLFDERFFLYTEDVDLCASVRRLGRAVEFAAGVTIVHRRGRSRASAPAATAAAYRRSHLAFYEKHHPRWAPVLRAYLRLRGQI